MKKMEGKTGWKQWKRVFSEKMGSSVSLTVMEKKITFRPLKLAVIAVVAFLVLSLFLKLLMIPAHQPRSLDLGLEGGVDDTVESYGENVLLYNNQSMKAINHKGDLLWTVKLALSAPVVEQGGDYILAADLEGSHKATLYKKGETVREYTPGKDLISAKVNAKGTCAFALSADGYKGSVLVVDKKGKELFRWNSNDGYIMDLDLSDNGHYLAVAQLHGEGETAGSKIQFIDLYQKRVIRTAEQTDAIVGEVCFAGNRLITVSDIDLVGYSGSGKEQYRVSFVGKRPGLYDMTGEDLLAFVVSDNRGNTVLELYNLRGKKTGSFVTDGPITAMAVYGDGVVFSCQRELLQINQRGKLKKRIPCEHDIKEVGVFGNGKTVLAVGSTKTELLWLP